MLSDAELRAKVITSEDGRFKALLATVDDRQEIAQLMSQGFSGEDNQPLFPKLYPRMHTPEGTKIMDERLKPLLEGADPICYFVKVIDTSRNNKIVTQGRWIIRETGAAPMVVEGGYWDIEEDRLEVQTEGRIYFELRNKTINETEGRVYCISALCSDPDTRGQGGGALWARWGLEEADKEGALTIVEASIRGIGYYEKQGFVFHHMVNCGDQMPEKWNRNNQTYAWMTRQARPPPVT